MDRFRAKGRPQVLDGLAQRVPIGSGHLGFELFEGNAEIVGNMESGDKLPLVFESGSRGLQSSVGGSNGWRRALRFGLSAIRVSKLAEPLEDEPLEVLSEAWELAGRFAGPSP